MQKEEQIIQQLQKDINNLLQSPPQYMRQVARVSKKIVSLEIIYMLFVINKIYQIIHDQSQPIKRKLFAFRFIKDTLLLASHSFYILTIIQLFPFIASVIRENNKKTDNGLEYLIKSIGPKPGIQNEIQIKTFSTKILQLLNEIVKWTGMHIKFHPFCEIPFSSVFKVYSENFQKVRSIQITDLHYDTKDSVKTYEKNYQQRDQTLEYQSLKQARFIEFLIDNWISLPEDDKGGQQSLNILQKIVQTGDSLFIKAIVKCLKPLIQSEITGYQAIQIVRVLAKVKQLQFFILFRDQLLYSIAYYVIKMSKQKSSQVQSVDPMQILRQVHVLRSHAVKLKVETLAFDQFFIKMKNQRIFTNLTELEQKEDSFEISYYLSSNQVIRINSQKKKYLSLKDNLSSIQRIRQLKYKPKKIVNKQDQFQDKKKQNVKESTLNKENVTWNLCKIIDFVIKQVELPQENQSSQLQSKQLVVSKGGQSFQKLKEMKKIPKKQIFHLNNPSKQLSSSKQQLHFQNESKNNIYMTKQINEEKISAKQSRSFKRPSKKSLGKVQKATSFKFGLQRVKSNQLIYNSLDQEKNQLKEKNERKNLSKANLTKFNNSSHEIVQMKFISPKRDIPSLQSDNNPYKDEPSDSSITNHKPRHNQDNFLSLNDKKRNNQEIIFVQETINKPKFGFINDEPKSNSTDKMKIKRSNKNHLPIKNLSDEHEKLQSIKSDLQMVSEGKASQYSSIPSDFKQAVKSHQKQNQQNDTDRDSEIGIKFNKYPDKVKHLQKQIQKAQQAQLLYQQKMKEKQEQYEKLLNNLPPKHDSIHKENKKLKIQLQQEQKRQAQKLAIRQQKDYKPLNKKLRYKDEIPFSHNQIFSLGKIKPFDSCFTKKITSNKCLLEKNEIFEFGYALKKQKQQKGVNKELAYSACFYFKFKVKCEKFNFKLVSKSLILADTLDNTVLNIVANKQLKIQQKIIGYRIIKGEFEIPLLQIEIKVEEEILNQLNEIRKKQNEPFLSQKYEISVPCSLLNFLDFHAPTKAIEKIKTKYATQAQFSCRQYRQSLQGQCLIQIFKSGKWHQLDKNEAGFYLSYYTYIREVKEKRSFDERQFQVYFKELKSLERKEVNLIIRKLNRIMFYIESDNQFEADKIVLTQISKVLTR